MGAADGSDGRLVISADEACAIAHLEVLGAAEVPDEFLTDGLLDAARHVEVEVGHSLFLGGADVRAELDAVLAADLRIAGIHRGLHERHRVGILANEPVQALLLERTTLDETHGVMVDLLAEDLFLRRRRLWLIVFLCFHECLCCLFLMQRYELFVISQNFY